MNMLRPLSILLAGLLLINHAYPQAVGVPDSSRVSFVLHGHETCLPPASKALDTLLETARFYNPVSNWIPAFAQQGNTGQACLNLIPDFSPPPGFTLMPEAIRPFLFNPDSTKYYTHFFPFTDIHYMMGGKKEQFLEVIHSQNIGQRFTAGANVRIINAPGSYTRQKSDISNLSLTLQYNTRDKRYQAAASFTQNVLKLDENGGIVQDSLFENNDQPDRRTIPVNLAAAQTRARESVGQLWQTFTFLRDSSLDKYPLLRYLPVQASLVNQYSAHGLVYEDAYPFSNIYPFLPKDSLDTQDYLQFQLLNNRLSLSNPGHPKLRYHLGIRHQSITIQYEGLNKQYHQLTPFAGIGIHLPLSFHIKLEGQKVHGGYQDGDGQFDLSCLKAIYPEKQARISLAYWLRVATKEPGWNQRYTRGNLFNWTYDFTKEKTTSWGGKLSSKWIETGYTEHLLQHVVVNLPHSALPWQLSESLRVKQFYFQLKFGFSTVKFENRIDFQQVDKDQWLRLPELISRHSLYMELNLFKGALILQPGFDLYYQKAYYADAYMPATHSFYLQNDKKLSDQFLVDFFVNMKVSRARIFLKYNHFNALFGPVNYYQIPAYPLQDASVRFGIFWLLRDFPDTGRKVRE